MLKTSRLRNKQFFGYSEAHHCPAPIPVGRAASGSAIASIKENYTDMSL